MKELLKRFVREEEGQDLIEYALLTAIIVITVVATLRNIGTWVNGTFSQLYTNLTTT